MILHGTQPAPSAHQQLSSATAWEQAETPKNGMSMLMAPLSSFQTLYGHSIVLTLCCLTQSGHFCLLLHPEWELNVLISPLHCGSSAGLAFIQTLQSACRAMIVLINGKLAFLNQVVFLQEGRASQQKYKVMHRSCMCIS